MFSHDISPQEFRRLRSRKIRDYFHCEHLTLLSLEPDSQELKDFVRDFDRLLSSRQGMQGRSRARDFRHWWQEKQSVYLTWPVIREHAELSLSEFVDELYLHFLSAQSERANSSWVRRTMGKFIKSRYAVASLLFGAFLIERSAGFLWSLAVLGPGVQMVNSYTQTMVTPLAQTASQAGAKDLASAASLIQGWLTQRERLKEISNELHAKTDELKNEKFTGAADRDRGRWARFEHAFFDLFMKYNQTLPSHLREGRAAYKDFMMFTPVGLAANLASFDTQYWTHRREKERLEERERRGRLNATERRERVLHQNEMEAAESRIAGTLAAWKLFELMFPEYSDQSRLDNAYKTFSRSMRFDVYVRQFARQMDEVLGHVDAMLDHQGKA